MTLAGHGDGEAGPAGGAPAPQAFGPAPRLHPPFDGLLNPIGAWSLLLVDALVDAGVQHLIITPGSRSTPFALAALRHCALTCTSLIDERVASFHALGLAKATHQPTALLCTSGSAPAHYFPAVIEASLAHAPLVVLSADRPLSLQDCGAPQTVDQVKLFGDHVRFFADLGHPEMHDESLRALRRMVVQGVAASLHPVPGPVHLNARARKPLEPGPAAQHEQQGAALAARIAREPVTRVFLPEVRAADQTCDELARLVRSARRGMIVCGPAPIGAVRDRSQVLAFARKTGFALLAEATSQLRFASDRDGVVVFDSFDTVLRAGWASELLAPDLILQLGPAPTSGAWDRWLRHQRAPRIVVTPHGWQDPHCSAHWLVTAPTASTLAAVTERLPAPLPRDAWQQRIECIERDSWLLVNDLLAGENGMTEGACARAVVACLPSGALLALGNSLPVRQVDAWCAGQASDLAVLSQRGANGIDGAVASASGAARAWGRPAALLVGDVTFSHDLGGLAAARLVPGPFAIVVVQNSGGRIFEQLPIAKMPGIERDLGYWTTPPRVDVSRACATFGLSHVQVSSEARLCTAMREAMARDGCTVVEVMVPASDAIRQNRALWQARDHRGPA